jgi:hypothetical protein
MEKRQDMNVEYLKNVLIKFLMSENKKVSLIRVIFYAIDVFLLDNGAYYCQTIIFG